MMKRTAVFAIAICAASITFSQIRPPGLSTKSAEYHAYRLLKTEPSFELTKVKGILKTLKRPRDEGVERGVADKVFGRLSTEAKFTYCMIHGEVFSQNCDGMPAVLDEENKIFAQPSGAFGDEQDWSDRQKRFLHSRRSSVIRLLKSTIRSRHRVGVNLKKAILEIDATEIVPILELTYLKDRKDHDVLSVLSVLMKHESYGPYVKSAIYKALYTGPNASYQTSIPYTRQAEKFILAMATRFHKSHM
jgi:hypothetical protein